MSVMGRSRLGARIAGQFESGVVPVGQISWLHKAVDVAGVTMIGLLPIAIVVAAIGYALVLGGWRLRTLIRWSKRRAA